MDIHKNAVLTVRSREALACFVPDQGHTCVCARTAGKWVKRYRSPAKCKGRSRFPSGMTNKGTRAKAGGAEALKRMVRVWWCGGGGRWR